MRSDADPPEMRERDEQPDRPVTAHAEQAHVVEKDDARRAARVQRLDEQRADEHVVAARLIHHRAAETVVLFVEDPRFLRHAPRAEIRPTRDDHARGLAAGVGVDDADAPPVGAERTAYAHKRETP